MYDKVRLFLDGGVADVEASAIASTLQYPEEAVNWESGRHTIKGRFNGLFIQIGEAGVLIEGSLAKFKTGNNICTLDRQTTGEAIEMLEDSLKIPLHKARVLSLEFGRNFVMKSSVEAYLSILDYKPHFTRIQANSGSLYYNGAKRKGRNGRYKRRLAFYDKIAEAIDTGQHIPAGMENAHLLRYELRYGYALPQQTGRQIVTAEILQERAFYSKMLQLYREAYFSINKKGEMTTKAMETAKTPRDIEKRLLARLINEKAAAGVDIIGETIRDAEKAGVFQNSTAKYRALKNLRDIASSAEYTQESTISEELDEAIKNACIYF